MQNRLTATLWGDSLCEFIPFTARSLALLRKDNRPVRPLEASDARMLARRRMIAGCVRNGVLRYLVALAAPTAIERVLRTDPPKDGEITKNRVSQGSAKWAVRLDRAKTGNPGGFRTLHIGLGHVEAGL